MGLINEVKFSDLYITPDKTCYIWSGKTDCGLMTITFDDFPEFLAGLETEYDGKNCSYLLNYKGATIVWKEPLPYRGRNTVRAKCRQPYRI
ncbi:MAG: hypothetical protein ACLU99_07925 [Alphaproteobacteria bacterium]